jgi:hypothetical protein
MVMKTRGQSLLEFLIILSTLFIFGLFFSWKMVNEGGGHGAVVKVQDNAEKKIGND